MSVKLQTARAYGKDIHKMKVHHGDAFMVYDIIKQMNLTGNILDIACGTGYGQLHIVSDKNKIYGVDIDKDTINHAKKYFANPNIEYSTGDIVQGLHFPDHFFDSILSFETIEHLWYPEDTHKYLSELKRLLKPGGKIFFSTPYNGIFEKIKSDEIVQKDLKTDPLGHKIEYTSELLKKTLNKYFDYVSIGYIRRKGALAGGVDQKVGTLMKIRDIIGGTVIKMMPVGLKYKIDNYLGNPYKIENFELVRGEDFQGAIWTMYIECH